MIEQELDNNQEILDIDKILNQNEEIEMVYVSRETAESMGLLNESKRLELLKKNIIVIGSVPQSKCTSINILQEFERCRELEREWEEEDKRDRVREVMSSEPRRWLIEGSDDCDDYDDSDD